MSNQIIPAEPGWYMANVPGANQGGDFTVKCFRVVAWEKNGDGLSPYIVTAPNKRPKMVDNPGPLIFRGEATETVYSIGYQTLRREYG